MEETKRLETGVTKLGKVWALGADGFYAEFDVYYGNILKPFINNEVGHMPIEWIVDGISYDTEEQARKAVETIQGVKAGRGDYSIIEVRDEYKAMLKAFLEEEQPDNVAWQIEQGGLEYEIPMDSEVFKASIDMLNQEKMALQKMHKAQEERIASTNELNKAKLAQESNNDVNTSAPAEGDTPPEEIEETRTNDVSLVNEGEDSQIGVVNPEENKLTPTMHAHKTSDGKLIGYRICTALLVLGLALASAYGYLMTKKYEKIKGADKIVVGVSSQSEELDENGNPIILEEQYQLPLSTLEIEEGEAKVILYGFQTNLVDGEFITQAKQFGEYKLDADTYHIETKAEREAREAKEAEERARAEEEERKRQEEEERKRQEEEEKKKQEEANKGAEQGSKEDETKDN